jgi:hypothetical protein
LLTFYFLKKHKYFNLSEVSGDLTKQAVFLHSILDIPLTSEIKNSHVYKNWREILNDGKHINKENLLELLKIFQKTSFTVIIKDIENKIEKIEQKE